MLTRYKLLLSNTLTRYFPRTAAYLEAEKQAAAERAKVAAKKPLAQKKAAATKRGAKRASADKAKGEPATKKFLCQAPSENRWGSKAYTGHGFSSTSGRFAGLRLCGLGAT